MREEDVLVGGFIQKNQSVVWDHAEVETKFLLYIWVGGVCGGYGGGEEGGNVSLIIFYILFYYIFIRLALSFSSASLQQTNYYHN